MYGVLVYSLIFEYRVNFTLNVSAVFVVAEYSFLCKEILIFSAQTPSFFGCGDCFTDNSAVS